MRTTSVALLASLGLAPILAFSTVPSHAATVEIADGDVATSIAVADVARRGDAVVGTLINRGGEEIRDIRLLIDMPFLWKDELHPGEESPGRSSVLTVAGPLAPHGRLAFEFTPNPPLAERSDGRYAEPKVRIMGYQSIALR